jgi:D-serine deaminase-like pyridoxal phosphate-dependent protein
MRPDELQTPALLVDLDRVDANVARVLEMLDGRPERWRPHVKTTKIPEVLDMLLGAGVRRFKCATSREARILLERAREPIDLLVAMPHRGANLRRIARLAAEHRGHRVSLLAEDPGHAREVVATATDTLGLYVDLNPGYDRTGIPHRDRARIRATAEAAGSAFRGLHDYEGHVRAPDAAARADACRGIYDELLAIAEDLREVGCAFDELITSGTPTFANALGHPRFAEWDHQVGPGTVVYWDLNSEPFGLTGFGPAATVLTHVISVPERDRVTCDAGSKAIDAAGGDPCCAVAGHPGLRAGTPSEEHLPLRVVDGDPPRPGSLLRLVPAHVCPTVNLADEAALLRDDEVVSIVPVAARGHELTPPEEAAP